MTRSILKSAVLACLIAIGFAYVSCVGKSDGAGDTTAPRPAATTADFVRLADLPEVREQDASITLYPAAGGRCKILTKEYVHEGKMGHEVQWWIYNHCGDGVQVHVGPFVTDAKKCSTPDESEDTASPFEGNKRFHGKKIKGRDIAVFSAKAKVRDVKPDTKYYYCVYLDNGEKLDPIYVIRPGP